MRRSAYRQFVTGARARLAGILALACWLLLAGGLDLLALSSAFAQGTVAQRSLLVLRGDQAPASAIKMRIDRTIEQTLADLGFAFNLSPIPFRDAQLALGCAGSPRECAGSVAAALESEQLAVISFEPRGAAARLELYLFAPEGARSDSVELALDAEPTLEPTVRKLARRVYGGGALDASSETNAQRPLEQPATSALPTRPAPRPAAAVVAVHSERPRNSALRAVGWSATTVGGALLIAGLATSLAANHASAQYARREIRSQDDADHALASYARARHQAISARVLLATGSTTLLAGAALLLWERLLPRRQDRKLEVSAAPTARGALLTVNGSLERGL